MPYFKQLTKNVIINEDTTPKQVKYVAELNTALAESGTETWIPEDSIKLVPKVITKDGVYIAKEEAGHPYGYSEVEIVSVDNVAKYKKGIKAITKNGEYVASKETGSPYYYYTTVFVNVGAEGEELM